VSLLASLKALSLREWIYCTYSIKSAIRNAH